MLFHISEEPGIVRFEPRASECARGAVVWAIDEARLCNYLLPRDCPRVTCYAGPDTTTGDVERFLGSSPAVVAIESAWALRDTVLASTLQFSLIRMRNAIPRAAA